MMGARFLCTTPSRHILDSMVITAAFSCFFRLLELVLDTIWALKRTRLRRFIVHLSKSQKWRLCQVACRRLSYRLKAIGCSTTHLLERMFNITSVGRHETYGIGAYMGFIFSFFFFPALFTSLSNYSDTPSLSSRYQPRKAVVGIHPCKPLCTPTQPANRANTTELPPTAPFPK